MVNVDEKTKIIGPFYETLQGVLPKITDIKPEAEKWSLKEIVGHLVDSASNNHQRFVRLQLEGNLEFPLYGAEEWIAVEKYNSFDWKMLVDLWYSFNCLLLHVIENADSGALGNSWVFDGKPLSLEFLMDDYYTHLEWHIKQFNEYKGAL